MADPTPWYKNLLPNNMLSLATGSPFSFDTLSQARADPFAGYKMTAVGQAVPPSILESLAYSGADAALFNRAPQVMGGLVAAGDVGASLLQDPRNIMNAQEIANQSYAAARQEEFARRKMLDERAPIASIVGETIGTLANPITRFTPAKSALARIGVAGLQTAANQLGEENADLSAATGAGVLGAGATGLLEAIPLAGKVLKYVRNFAEEAGLGLKGSAMKKAMNKQVQKTALGEGYDAVRQSILNNSGDPDLLAQATKIFSSAPDRIDAYMDLADNQIKALISKQDEIAAQAAQAVKPAFGRTKKSLPSLDFSKGKSFEKNLKSLPYPEDKLKFEEAYNSVLGDVLENVNFAKKQGIPTSLNVEDLLQKRREISAGNLYNEVGEKASVKAKAATAAINDINEAISKNLQKYEAANLIKKGSADEFIKSGQDSKNLITFKTALEGSRADENMLARASDLLRLGIGGSVVGMGLYGLGFDPYTATGVGALAATPRGMGAIGAALRKGGNVAGNVGELAGPAARAAIKTQVPTENLQLQQPVSEADKAADAKAFLESLNAPIAEQPQAPALDQDQLDFLRGLGGAMPDTAAPQAPMAGSLPSQPSGAMQGAALSGQPDLTPYYAALAQTESSINPMAKNPESSAKGLFQSIDDTAKRTGLENAYDVKQQKKAVEKLTLGHAQKFGTDPSMLYAAHYLGQGTLDAWLSGKPLTAKQQGQILDFTNKALPNFRTNMQAVMQPAPSNDIMAKFNSLLSQG